MISLHDKSAVDAYCKKNRIDRHQLKIYRNALYKKGLSDDAAFGGLTQDASKAIANGIGPHCLSLEKRFDSNIDGASKLIFKTEEGYLIESVILRMTTGRTSLCISSQVGCAANCSFCATGQMGLAHSLKAEQIVDQVLQAQQIVSQEGKRLRNIVFMGMGEPFHNDTEIRKAIDVLRSSECFYLSQNHILVSTVGIPESMILFAQDYPDINLALSLHSARQSQRETIIPLAKRYHLDQLRDALVRATDIQQRPIMIEYIMLKGINDLSEDIDALSEYLQNIPVHINLIPFNAIESNQALIGTEKTERENFGKALKELGFKVTLRYSLGSDIDAACGQLTKTENRARHSELQKR